MYTSFGYFEDPEEDVRVARNIYESLRPGGVLLLETMGKERLANIWRDSNWRREEGGTIVIEERRITRDWTWIENTWTIIREGRQRTFAVAHRVYSAAEIKTLFGACGFGDIKVFGSLQGDPYDNNATRLVMAARK
jgi:SAM-dependent methyltransferase